MLPSQTGQKDNVNEETCHFVGEADLPESERDDLTLAQPHTYLVESRRRFVLFPIQYPDVGRFISTCSVGFSQGAIRYGECASKPRHPS